MSAMDTEELTRQLKAANRWRSAYNPLRGITLPRVVQMLEAGERGMYADVQWTYRLIEKRWATLKALRSRRLSAIGKLDWTIKKIDDSPAAEKQAAVLKEAYGAICNLKKAIRFLALASFRGYAHLEKVRENEDLSKPVTELRIVDQWFWCRDGVYGEWLYNPSAKQTSQGMAIDPESFIIREIEDPINEIALVEFLRSNLSKKDWDGFVETYGIPPLFVELPPGTDPTKQTDYQDAAEAVVGDMRGTLPAGAKIQTVDAGSRGANPFLEHLKYQDEQVVLAGTGGKLTMLSEATGLGGGATASHQTAFDEIAQDEAADISECFQKQLDEPLLEQLFPGQPRLAYFELAAADEEDLNVLALRTLQLSSAGYALDPVELSQKFGLKISAKPAVGSPFGVPGVAPVDPAALNRRTIRERLILNRDGAAAADPQFETAALAEAAAAFAKDRAPIAGRLVAMLQLPEDKLDSALLQLLADLNGPLANQVLKSPAGSEALQKIFGTALVAGAAQSAIDTSKS